MRKKQYDRALNFLKLLDQAHDELKKIMQRKENKSNWNLLVNCQEGAIELGNLIEETEGEHCKTIPFLEQYCEQIYCLYEKVTQGENVDADKEYEILNQFSTKIENSIKHDIPIRQEVVFLPYKASMWDSLESVWKAAVEDELCDAYVIPIPYFDKDPDDSFREMHYEGDQYPAYVPITNYEEYDFINRRPDVIYIHNPYDNYNIATSVHPFFYAENLKQFTDMLVYIPYFVLDEISPDDKQRVKKMAHFCAVPGVVHADKVIVQSEDMRQIYINVLTKVSGEESRSMWENKILGIGSPKIDKVLNTRKEDIELLDDWLKIIQKSDGSYKKIVLYNTSVNALLENDEKMLIKMRDVFRLFKENKDKIALLWRPHPLIKATISSMRPELWNEYEKIVEEYRAEGWGIYDDTADVDRAVILSDAYYGDRSSVVQLYQKTGKPVMIQSVNVLSE